jgi:hypothetical protein
MPGDRGEDSPNFKSVAIMILYPVEVKRGLDDMRKGGTMPEITIKEALHKAYIKVRPERAAIEKFKANCITLLEGIQANPRETEELLKNLVADFLKNTWYSPDYNINTASRIDLVIHTGKNTDTPIGVIIEAKRPSNKNEMINRTNVNAKAMQELLLYYLRETIDNKNLALKHLIITNAVEWYVFDARDFYHCFSQNKKLIDLYNDFKTGSLLEKDNSFFYNQIAAPYIKENETILNYTYFNITDYEKIIRNQDKEADNKLIGLYKLLSPVHLLKLPFANDSNNLNQGFYSELLHIMGLSEEKEHGKKVIVRNKPENRQEGSLIEKTIFRLADYDGTETNLFEYALELTITWINRILFLKLLESQQIQYQKGNPDYAFLNSNKVRNYSDLHTLFFNVLAKKPEERPEHIKKRYANIPYLNSSLFDMTSMEKTYFSISNLPDTEIDIFSGTVLKTAEGKKRTGTINALEYIFEFLNAYDFSSEGSEEIQEENKTLINASVLGLIFEKINGYKDGSYFTPGFITTYICREVIRSVVVHKFNEVKGWKAKTLDDLFNKIEDIPEANKIINSLTLCDPAVGSGHFLVSALNEIMAIKGDLGILADSRGRKLKGYKVEIVNDELMIFDENGDCYTYHYKNEESRRIQETIFQEKRRIIENCLFGVDINSNSVKICRLRLWIELLKSAYYTPESKYTELETLPNIDINIKCGNSLISRFDIDIDLKEEEAKLKFSVKDYQEAVYQYKNAVSKEEKSKLDKLILEMKNNFRGEVEKHTRLNRDKYRLQAELAAFSQGEFFDLPQKEKEKKEKRIREIADAIILIDQQIEDIKAHKLYDNAFEWRFEFPEILDPEGNFIGFDAVIGNPPYIRVQELDYDFIDYSKTRFSIAWKRVDISILFIELANSLLNKSGINAYITSNQFLSTEYGRNARKFLLEKCSIQKVLNFGDLPVFQNALTYVSIFILGKGVTKDFLYNKIVALSDKISENNQVIKSSFLDENPWTLDAGSKLALIDKLKKNYPKLLSKAKCWAGIITGKDDILMFDKKDLEKITFEKEILLPVLRAQDCKRFNFAEPSKYVIYPYIEVDGKTVLLSECELKKQFPKAYNYLIKNKDELLKRKDSRKEVSENKAFYGLIRFGRYSIFKQPKIISPGEVSGNKFALDNTGSGFSCARVFAITIMEESFNIKLLLGLLNSKIVAYFLHSVCPLKAGGYFQYSSEFIDSVPIPNNLEVKKEETKEIIKLVDKLLNNNKSLNAKKQEENNIIENKINVLVYQLYDITEEEKSIIENTFEREATRNDA